MYFAELPRRVHLVAFVTSLLIVVAALVGTLGSITAKTDARAVQARSENRELLEAVVSSAAQNQVDIAALSQEALDPQGLASITRLYQALEDSWQRYEDAAYGDNKPPRAAAQVSAEIGQQGKILQLAAGAVKPTATALKGGASAQVQSLTRTAADLAILQTDDRLAAVAAMHTQNTERVLFLDGLLVAAALAFLTVVVGNTLIARGGRRYEKAAAMRESDLDEAVKANEFESRLQRALDLSATESRVYGVVRRAFEEAAPDVGVELLQADSSRAHFEQLVTTGDMSQRHCSVQSPQDCPAAQRGAVLEFASSEAIDACPYLQEQSEPCSAVCVPVSVAGVTVGVVHAAGEHGNPMDGHPRNALELVARRSSDRLGMLRAFARSEVQANTDPLTGLRNRRSLEDEVARLAVGNTSYAVAFGDLDRFKMLNDVHGHGAGDQALRLFAQAMRAALRPNDLVGRYGGEEFVIVLPECSQSEAVAVLERIRVQLAATISKAGGPSFTVSFGLAEARPGETFSTVIAVADAALLEAKDRGRNRVVVAGVNVGDADGTGAGEETTSADAVESRPKEFVEPSPVH
jgi:diguanylate cyclase (GGDEF)-like protein